MRKLWPKIITAAVLIGLSAFLLKGDVWTFWTWWLLAGILGFCAMPLSGRLFSRFDDKGWIFSKALAVGLTGFLTWFLVSVKIIPFTTASCIGVVVVCAVFSFLLFSRQLKKGIDCLPAGHENLVFWEEVLFFAAFLLWTYLAGFRPQAYGTEKFMDYGFMEAMMRSTVLPARDLWYSEGHINYYYGGQYFAVFLTKLSATKVEVTYNLMRAFVAGFAFAMPFSLVRQMTKDRLGSKMVKCRKSNSQKSSSQKGNTPKSGSYKYIPAVSGLTAGIAVSIAGNMHYVVYAQILPLIQKLRGIEGEGYWFPDATRYIGYNPDVPDKTIHEFPCYSFVLGDLHAHVVNIMFVLLLTGMLYAWMKIYREKKKNEEVSGRKFWAEQLLMPHILLAGLFLGMFKWTNFWDFVIYFVVTGGVVLFTNIIRFEGRYKDYLLVTAAQAVEVIFLSYVAILPFTLQFETMVDGVALAKYHSLPHQMLILWGLPVILTVTFLVSLISEKTKGKKKKNLYQLMRSIHNSDLFALIMGLCGIGLVLIPELVYVRDIYEQGNARANTMFKLTYQAYMLLGMTMAFVIYRIFFVSRQKIAKALAGIGLFLLVWTVGYFGESVTSWYGQVWQSAQYEGLNATAFLEQDFPEDASAIRWLKKNIKGSPVVLEANGDSYTGFERVSAMTGLPTVLGWYVHEWLWRNDVADLNVKSADIKTIYTSADEKQVEALLAQYDVSYIFLGSKEREKYEDSLNEPILRAICDVVFEDEVSGTCIFQVAK